MPILVAVICILIAVMVIFGVLPFVLGNAKREIKLALFATCLIELFPLCGLIMMAATLDEKDLLGGVVGGGLIALLALPVPFLLLYWYRLQQRLWLGLLRKVTIKSE